MSVALLYLTQSCVPTFVTETPARVVSAESGFDPFAIRITGPAPLSRKPASSSEAIELATSLTAERQDIQLGLGAISTQRLRTLNITMSETFDPRRNLQVTAGLLDEYYRLAMKAGADSGRPEQLMLQSYYDGGGSSVGSSLRYEKQVEENARQLDRALATAVIADNEQDGDSIEDSHVEVTVEAATSDQRPDEAASAPSWDVFSLRRRSPVLVFQNSQMEQSE
ncbi:transglycosylase SLT domain-containing protein [Ciceribacter thiooxidans]|uniref:Transglycosylase SLT domain-containing protein n=1 Tax=Ciceribacter thiooxidans TaxID=1969821 RepID=A0ABV7HWU0_9HYPH|nr:transglycosylase SLT domain-containing protein [Ciceribacter thiooxidans]